MNQLITPSTQIEADLLPNYTWTRPTYWAYDEVERNKWNVLVEESV